jgi:hypothetical protein
MKKWEAVILMMGVLFAGGLANAAIYINGNLYSEDVLDINADSILNHWPIELTENSIVNIYYNIDEGINQSTITASDNSVVNLFSDVPVFVNFDLMNMFWTYEDIQISYQNYPEQISPSISGTDVYLGGGHSEIADVDLANDAVINVFVPEPTTLLLFGIGGLLARPKVK